MAGFRVRRKSPVAVENEALSGALRELSELVGWLGTLYGVSLPVPTGMTLSALKGFLAEPLAPGSTHPWVRSVSHLKLRDRLSVLGSLFLFRKRLPVLSPPSLSEYQTRMGEVSPDPDPKFIAFITQEMKRMFPSGWDRGWKGKVLGTTLSPSACSESSRKRGGNLGVLEREEWVNRKIFCDNLLDKYSSFRPNVDRAKLALVSCDGKSRVVSCASVDANVLSPYHKLIYDRVSSMPWCLHGEATAAKMSDFTTVRGELFVSGDYESATDNLNQKVQSKILSCINDSCRRVPYFVRQAGARTLTGELDGPLGITKVHRGQLMGNYLSFPLLCLVNYLTFRFFIRRDVPVKINGDDIVFRSTPNEYERWKSGVSSGGLTLSEGKTAISNRWFSVNSTFFVASEKKVRNAPVIRSTSFFKPIWGEDEYLSLTGRWNTLRCFGGWRREYLQVRFLRRFSKEVWKSQRSLRRGWGWLVSESVLRQARMLHRERFYSSLPGEVDKPFPVVDKGYFRTSIPDGWKKVFVRTGSDDPGFGQALVANCWNPERAVRRNVDLFEGTFRYVSSPCNRKRSRLLGYNLRDLRTFLNAGRPALLDTRKKKGMWVWKESTACKDLRFHLEHR